jgi:hypothetical protein
LVPQAILVPGHVSDKVGCASERAIVKLREVERWSY